MYLRAYPNNRAETVLHLFNEAVAECGWPSRVRSDKGGENIDVARAMVSVRGTSRRSHITGSSVHNQRIERLWRDTFRCVEQLYYALFYELEDSSLLNVDRDMDLFALQYVFIPRINVQLTQFASAWNNHSLRTENNLTPLQLWTRGLLSPSPTVQEEILEGLIVGDDYGVESNSQGTNSFGQDMVHVIVPEIDLNLSEQEVQYLQEHFYPLERSDSNGVDVYVRVLDYLQNLRQGP